MTGLLKNVNRIFFNVHFFQTNNQHSRKSNQSAAAPLPSPPAPGQKITASNPPLQQSVAAATVANNQDLLGDLFDSAPAPPVASMTQSSNQGGFNGDFGDFSSAFQGPNAASNTRAAGDDEFGDFATARTGGTGAQVNHSILDLFLHSNPIIT